MTHSMDEKSVYAVGEQTRQEQTQAIWMDILQVSVIGRKTGVGKRANINWGEAKNVPTNAAREAETDLVQENCTRALGDRLQIEGVAKV